MKNTSPQTYEKKPCRADLSQDILPQYQRTFSSPQGEFHFHEDYELFLFLDGKADIFVEQSRYMLERGSLLAFHSSEVHRAARSLLFLMKGWWCIFIPGLSTASLWRTAGYFPSSWAAGRAKKMLCS